MKVCFFKQKTAYEIRLSLVGSEMCIRDGPIMDMQIGAGYVHVECCLGSIAQVASIEVLAKLTNTHSRRQG